jgi:hypothetical protein
LFERASARLDADEREPAKLPDVLPHDYPADARRLADASTAAWVFGGMGSWNDLGFSSPEEEQQYEDLTRDLYGAVINGLVAAVNAERTRGSDGMHTT